MEQLNTAFVFALILTFWISSSGAIGHQQIKLSIVKREATLATLAVRHLTIKTQQDKVQLTSMATDFVLGFSYATFSLNNVVANIFDEAEHKALVSFAHALSTSANDVQQSLLVRPEKLIEDLIESLENIVEAINYLEGNFKGSFSNFARVQLDRMNNLLTYAIYKLKFEAILFKKTNKELQTEMVETFNLLSAAINSLPCLNAATENALERFLQLTSIYSERNTYKLQNWVEVNPDKAGDVQFITETFVFIGAFYGKEIRGISERYNVTHVKDEVLKTYEVALKLGNAISHVEYHDYLGGQEFLRSTIFDVVVIGRDYADNLKDILANTCADHDHVE